MTVLLFTVALAGGLLAQRQKTRAAIACMVGGDDFTGCRWYTPQQWRLYCALTTRAERRARR